MSRDSDGNPVIINTLLAYVKHLILSKDRTFITDEICSKFDLTAIKSAREIICKLVDPSAHYGYRGPNGHKSQRDLSVHAFDDIYNKLSFLDTSATPCTIACPSNELHLLLVPSVREPINEISVRDRLNILEVSHKDLQKTVLALMTSPPVSVPVPPLNQAVGNENIFVPDAVNFPSMPRSRSASVRSKRNLSEGAGDDSEYKLPREQIKKLQKRRKLSNSSSSYAAHVENGVPKKVIIKSFKWGQSSDVKINGFSGRTPDIFISKCSLDTEADMIKKHFVDNGIKIKNVELKSKSIAKTRSFKVSVETQNDFDKLITGELIPRNVKVEKFIYYKKFVDKKIGQGGANSKPAIVTTSNSSQVLENRLEELDSLGNDVIRPTGSSSSLLNTDSILQGSTPAK
jgi:hypothetical protein